ncbi:hypothetical protein EVG20_g5191 [Dentipellis fragilis]|uniref:Uncharacterized protein n=1 Tax=Dentipellis fragilis TaxID=205917 RepID=A0A4Y9YVY6_9AGAM|nr:hypothetical protein EVG20_g5191 [Dentipellis fragilis]
MMIIVRYGMPFRVAGLAVAVNYGPPILRPAGGLRAVLAGQLQYTVYSIRIPMHAANGHGTTVPILSPDEDPQMPHADPSAA